MFFLNKGKITNRIHYLFDKESGQWEVDDIGEHIFDYPGQKEEKVVYTTARDGSASE